jgi:hypothetical protein
MAEVARADAGLVRKADATRSAKAAARVARYAR